MVKKYDLTKVNKPEIDIDKDTITGDVDVRYSLIIPFLNRKDGFSVGIVLMNPSEADEDISDGTVNKLINFFYDFQIDEHKIKDITLCNVIPVYGPNTNEAMKQIRALQAAKVLDKVQELNESKLARTMEDKRVIVLGWGKPEVKTIPNLFYYKEVQRIVDLLSIIKKDELYVFDVKNANCTLTEHGDPRHAGRSAILEGLKKISISELYGLK